MRLIKLISSVALLFGVFLPAFTSAFIPSTSQNNIVGKIQEIKWGNVLCRRDIQSTSNIFFPRTDFLLLPLRHEHEPSSGWITTKSCRRRQRMLPPLKLSRETPQQETNEKRAPKTKSLQSKINHTTKRSHNKIKNNNNNNVDSNNNLLNSELLKFRQNRRNGAQLANQRLEVALKERDPNVNERSFNIVFLAYAAQSGRGDWMAPLRTEQLLQKMKRHPTFSPSVFTYNAVMEAWVNSATSTTTPTTTSTRAAGDTSKNSHPPNGNYKGQPSSRSQQDAPHPRAHHHHHHQKHSQQHSQHHNQQQPSKQRSIVQAKNFVLRLWDEMRKEQEGKPPVIPNTYTYNLILELYAKSPNPQDLKKAEEWFLNMKCEPDRQTFHLMFAAHANHGKAQQAERLLDGLIQDYRDQSKLMVNANRTEDSQSLPQAPSQVWFHCVLKAYAQDQKRKLISLDAGERADFLLAEMHRLYTENSLTFVRPDATTYNHVINVHAQAGNTERVEQLLRELDRLYSKSGGDLAMAPNRITYTTVLKSYANSVGQNDLLTAEDLFQRMLYLSAFGEANMSPSIISYNTMITIYAKTGIKENLQKATELLQQMQQQQAKTQPSSPFNLPRPPPPNAQSYTSILHGWSRTKNVREAGFKAEELLHMLELLPPNARRNLNWTTVYNSVITAWSRSGDKAAPQRVESLLNLLEDKCYDSGGTIAPDKTTFLCIADTYAKARVPDAEQRCDNLLVRMKQLEEAGVVSSDLRSSRAMYNAILNALAKSGQPSSKDKAEEILSMMETSPSTNLRPDIVTYSTVLDCHTKSGSNATAERAEELLRFVEGSYRNGNALLKPNAIFYSSILQAWAKTATMEGAEKAEWLLRRNEGLYQQGSGYEYTKPHAIMYNAVIDSIARSGMPEAGERAEDLLREMKSLYEAGDEEMKPTRRSFNAVMLAYRGQAADKAEQLLTWMEELAESGDLVGGPDVVSYNTAISSILQDRGITNPEQQSIAASRAQALLDRMEEKSIRPDATTYSCVIEAWLKCHDEKGAVMAELMLKKFLELVESTRDWDAKLDADIVWNVVNSYKNND